MAAIILAGGENTRIGQNKALLDLADGTLIETMVKKLSGFFDDILVVTPRPEEYNFLERVTLVNDLYPDEKGVLQAIYSGLSASKDEYNFVFAGDMPYLNLNLIRYLWKIKGEFDAVVPFVDFSKVTMHTIYSRDCLPVMQDNIEKKIKKVSRILRHLNVKYIPEEAVKTEDPELLSFFHVKTFVDYMLVQREF